MWVGIDEINELGLPTLMKKVYQQMMKNKIFK
jgi:hypothetical protein